MLLTPTIDDPMYFVATHEAGHAVAYILAHRALQRDSPSFERVFIRRDFSSPHIDSQNREVDCSGMCEARDLYNPGIHSGLFYLEPELRPGWKSEVLARMEWAILTSLAGPFAESACRNSRSKAEMCITARWYCGSEDDYENAEAVLLDYAKASKRRRRMPFFEDQTRNLILKSWPAIDALAKTLLVKETLDHDDAYAVVEPFLEASPECSTISPC